MSIAANDYTFGVKLEPIYTDKGLEVPNVRAVVRDDNRKPISVVGSKYHLITHEDALKCIDPLRRQLGKSKTNIMVWNDGANLAATFDYRERNYELKSIGETVGLRVIIENSYNSTSPLRVSVGGLVLSCSNGMVSSRALFDFNKRHVAKTSVPLLDAGSILEAATKEKHDWEAMASTKLSGEYDAIVDDLSELGYVTVACQKYVTEGDSPDTYWDLLQKYTYYMTHMSKLSFSRKVNTTRLITKRILAHMEA